MIDINLRADNCNGKQTLYLVEDEGEHWFVLTGEYKGAKIQIDFEELSRGELEDIKTAIELILDGA